MRPRRTRINVDRYKQLSAELLQRDKDGSEEEFFPLIGRVTVGFEQCEALVAHILYAMFPSEQLLGTVLSHQNSRTARLVHIKALLEKTAPRRRSRRRERLRELILEYERIGTTRDHIAHAVIAEFREEGTSRVLLVPSHHNDKKHIAGVPTYSFDVPMLKKLVVQLDNLHRDLMEIFKALAEENTKRLRRRAQRLAGKSDGAS